MMRENTMKMRMVVTDLDGTLLRSDKSVSERTVNVLRRLDDMDVKIAVATARASRSVYKLVPSGFRNIYYIFYNGASVYYNNEEIYSRYIDAVKAKEIVLWFLSRYPGIEISLEMLGNLYTNFDIRKMESWFPPFEQVDFQTLEFKPAGKILVNLRYVGDISEVYEFLPDDCRIIITDNGALGQILNKDVSKAGGVKALAEVLGIGLDEVISFGDDYNDIEMIRECGIGVAMGNAPQDIKDAAYIITASNDEDGVAIILEKLLENNMIISKSGFIW